MWPIENNVDILVWACMCVCVCWISVHVSRKWWRTQAHDKIAEVYVQNRKWNSGSSEREREKKKGWRKEQIRHSVWLCLHKIHGFVRLSHSICARIKMKYSRCTLLMQPTSIWNEPKMKTLNARDLPVCLCLVAATSDISSCPKHSGFYTADACAHGPKTRREEWEKIQTLTI